MSLLQREHHEILAGLGVGCGKSGPRRTNYVISGAKLFTGTSKFTAASRGSLCDSTAFFLLIRKQINRQTRRSRHKNNRYVHCLRYQSVQNIKEGEILFVAD